MSVHLKYFCEVRCSVCQCRHKHTVVTLHGVFTPLSSRIHDIINSRTVLQRARHEHLPVPPALRRGRLHHPPGVGLPHRRQHLPRPQPEEGRPSALTSDPTVDLSMDTFCKKRSGSLLNKDTFPYCGLCTFSLFTFKHCVFSPPGTEDWS